jgi:hypothetical protein
MTRFKHILAYSSLVFFALLLILILIAELAEDRVTKIALKQINAQIDAEISVGEIDFSLIKGFPDAMVELKDVSIATVADTMAHIDRVYISVEMRPLINSEFNITEIAVEGGMAYYKVDSLGHTNFDVFLVAPDTVPEADTTASQLLLSLEHLELSNLFCSYSDAQSQISACLYIDNGLASVYIDETTTKASFNGKLRANNSYYPQTKVHLMDETIVNIDVDYHNDVVNLRTLDIATDGANVQASGEIKQGASLYANVKLAASQVDVGELKKYIPDSLLIAYDVKQLSGIADFQATIKGEMNDSVMPQIRARWQLHQGRAEVAGYPELRSIHFSGMYSNGDKMNNATTSIGIDTLFFASGNSWVNINARLANLDQISYQFNIATQVNLGELAAFVPDSLVSQLNGTVNMQLATHGTLPQQYDMNFADYMLERTQGNILLSDVLVQMDSVAHLQNLNGHFEFKPNQIMMKHFEVGLPDYGLNVMDGKVEASYRGKLAKLTSVSVDVKEFDLSTAGSKVSGQASFKNPDKPVYQIDAKAKVNLAEMKVFAPDSLVKDMSGVVTANLRSAGSVRLDSLVDDLMVQLFTTSKLEVGFVNASVEMSDQLMQVKQLNGHVALAKDSIRIEKVSGELAGITFDADSTLIRNFYKAFWLNQPDTVKVDGYLNLGDIDFITLAPLMAVETENQQADESKPVEPVNYRFEAKGKVTAKSFWYENALFENISAFYNVSDSTYIVDQLKIDAFKGTTNSSLVYEINPDKTTVKFHNSVKGVDINALLDDFDDFMQYTEDVYISHNQLSGLFSGEFDGSFRFVNDSLDMNSIMMRGDFKLEAGRLIDYDIAVEMGEEYNIEELADLKFETIETKMFIYKNAAYVPLTNVKTNAFDITIFGMQEFDMDCEYYLRLYFKEILRKGKTDRIVKKQSDEKKVKDDGGTKGMLSIYPFYEIKNGKDNMGTRGNNHPDRRTMNMKIMMQEKGLKISFNPNDFNYNTGVK